MRSNGVAGEKASDVRARVQAGHRLHEKCASLCFQCCAIDEGMAGGAKREIWICTVLKLIATV